MFSGSVQPPLFNRSPPLAARRYPVRSQRQCYLVITLLASIKPHGYEWRPEVQGGIPATMFVLGIVKQQQRLRVKSVLWHCLLTYGRAWGAAASSCEATWAVQGAGAACVAVHGTPPRRSRTAVACPPPDVETSTSNQYSDPRSPTLAEPDHQTAAFCHLGCSDLLSVLRIGQPPLI